jgi:hypothetical protein
VGHKYEFHPVAEAFRMLTEPELDDLAADIKKNDLRVQIVLHEGMILDGRNRYLACLKVGVEPEFTIYRGDTTVEGLIAYVVSVNQQRRHDTVAQRAMAAVNLKSLFEVDARERQQAALKKGENPGNSPLAPVGANGMGRSRELAAAATGVSKNTIDRADKVVTKGTPELVAAVAAGQVSITTGAKLADKPKAEQKKAVAEAKAPKPPKSPKNGREKNGPRPFSKLEDQIGKCLRCADDVGRETGGGKFHREMIAVLGKAMGLVEQWRTSLR